MCGRRAAGGRVPVIVQVGHNCLTEARLLAKHAQQIGADMISAICPSYFKVATVAAMVDYMAEVAGGAPDLPFYYYHIPSLTGSALDVLEFLKIAGDRIENLVGLKYTETKLYEFQECLEWDDDRYDVAWGCDEMLGALATGAIGSTYNIAAALYQRVITAFTGGNLTDARRWQAMAVNMIRTLNPCPFHTAMKSILQMQGFNMGDCRLPLGSLSKEDVARLQAELEVIGFFEWPRAGLHKVAIE